MSAPNIIVIPACDEQLDIPAALLTISKSNEPTLPIVVTNGCSNDDKTYEYAQKMGAVTLRCEPAKMRATQVGLNYAVEHYPSQPIVNFGDADNLYPRRCIGAISRAVQRANLKNDGKGAILFGLGIYDSGTSKTVDLMRSGRVIRKAFINKIYNKQPMPYGFNYALNLDADSKILDAINQINPMLFVREESEICEAVTRSGGTINQMVSLKSFVFTRGDLIRSREEWRDFKGADMNIKTKYYKRNYPNIDFQPNAKGRK